MRPIFHPIEAAIVRIALGLPEAPEDHQLDLWRPARGVVSLHPDQSDVRNLNRAAKNALAGLILSGYEDTVERHRTVELRRHPDLRVVGSGLIVPSSAMRAGGGDEQARSGGSNDDQDVGSQGGLA